MQSEAAVTIEELEDAELNDLAINNVPLINIEHFYCLDHSKTGQLHLSVKVNYLGDANLRFDVGLRTEILEETSMSLFADDSLNLIERPYYSADYARAKLNS